MPDNISDIAEYYNNSLEYEHSRLERHQLEHDLTWRYLNQYLPSRGNILEIGAATGRYTLELARRGYQVTAVDLSPQMIETCRENLADQGLKKQVQLFVADARDLDPVQEKDFDVVLLMGPLYHLVMESDRRQALQEAHDRLRTGGRIFSAFISRFGIFGDLIKKTPEWIKNQAEMRSIVEKGKAPEYQSNEGFRGYFAKINEITPLHESMGFETISLAGVEPAIAADDESYNKLQGKQRKLWLDLFFEISTEPSIMAASRHLLYIGQKTGG